MGHRYSLGIINEDPLRGNPHSSVVYGVETDSSLLPHPAFSARRDLGRDLPRPFTREEQDPAIMALAAVGAIRVQAEGIETCSWNEDLRQIGITWPFKNRPELCRAYEMPPRRVADGATIHSWSYGKRLGPNATGQWSNMADGPKQPSLPPASGKSSRRSCCKYYRPFSKSDCRAASIRMRV